MLFAPYLILKRNVRVKLLGRYYSLPMIVGMEELLDVSIDGCVGLS